MHVSHRISTLLILSLSLLSFSVFPQNLQLNQQVQDRLDRLDKSLGRDKQAKKELKELIKQQRAIDKSLRGTPDNLNVEEGTWEGDLEHVTIDEGDEAGNITRESRQYILHHNGKTDRVYFLDKKNEQMDHALRVRVKGIRANGRIAADETEITQQQPESSNGNKAWYADGAATDTPPPSCQTTGPQSGLAILVNYQDDTRENTSVATTDARYFGETDSLAAYWNEASYGKTTLTGDAVGWYTIDVNAADLNKANRCQWSTVRRKAIEQAGQNVDLDKYSRFFVMMLNPPEGCGYVGLSSGCSYPLTDKNGNTRRVSAHLNFSGYMNSVKGGVGLSAHEGGHDLGLPHATTEDFGSEVLGAIGTKGTTYKEYGDMFDTMGGNWSLVPGHYSAMYKQRLGWLDDSNIKQVIDGSYDIEPTSINSSNNKALRIFRGSAVKYNYFGVAYIEKEYLWVESRANNGFDYWINNGGYNGAMIRMERVVKNNYGLSRSKSMLVDTKPASASNTRNEDFLDAPVYAGETFYDPYSGIGLTTNTVAANGAINVTVTIDPDKVDIDEDGIGYATEIEYGTEPKKEDTDGDGLTDLLEVCHDGDCSSYSPYPLGGDLNATTRDTDSDGLPDNWELRHKLDPLLSNADEDPDADGLTNIWEYRKETSPNNPDTDRDGLNDYDEVKVHRTDPVNPDTDDDGMKDGWEVNNGFNPKSDKDGDDDPDGDGLTNLGEFTARTDPHNPDTDDDGLLDGDEVHTYLTNPTLPDTDYDGISDGEEVANGTNPRSYADSDADKMSDDWENLRGTNALVDDALSDNDADGVINIIEFYRRTYPLDAASTPILVTWYIDIANTTGIEDGSAANPFSSIRVARNSVQPGDTLQLAAGFYPEGYFPFLPIRLSGAGTELTSIGTSIFSGYNLGWAEISGLTLSTNYGVYLQGSRHVKLDNCRISTPSFSLVGNTNLTIGHCIYARMNGATAFKLNHTSTLNLANTTISGFATGLNVASPNATVSMENSIVDTTVSVTGLVDTTNIQFNLLADGLLSGSQGNISAAPLFVDAVNDDYHLQATSASVDAGNPTSVFSQEPENNGDRINMGAYGNTAEATVGIDTDGDGLTDQNEACYDDDCGNYTPYDPINNLAGTDLNASLADTDGDGVSDADEISAGTNPLDPAE